jgi:hypothetical protein
MSRTQATTPVLDTVTNMVVAVLQSATARLHLACQPRFAATPGDAACYEKSLAALAQTFGELNAAAIALGFPTVPGLQTAVFGAASEMKSAPEFPRGPSASAKCLMGITDVEHTSSARTVLCGKFASSCHD